VKEQRKISVRVYIGLGSNLGNCRQNLLTAWARLGEVEGVSLLALSSPYKTEPVGMDSGNWFINAAGSILTNLEPVQLLDVMHEIEVGLGRRRAENSVKRQDRSVDLDLLFWSDRISKDPRLTLPHPEIDKRLFVLEPLVEIAANHTHPVSGKTMSQLLNTLRSRLQNQGQYSQVIRTTWKNNYAEKDN
jgi:2-amino-4-hydroxy-6-hydroxymethyldihydropteridine diphosphokinase